MRLQKHTLALCHLAEYRVHTDTVTEEMPHVTANSSHQSCMQT